MSEPNKTTQDDETDDTLLGDAGDGDEGDKGAAGAQTPEEKAAAEKAAADKAAAEKAAAEKAKAAGAPEKYADFTLPDGFEKDDALVAEFTPLAKEANLTQAQAQKIVDLYTKATAAAVQKRANEWEETVTDWRKTAEADATLMTEIDSAKRVLAFGDESGELRRFLHDSGIGNFPPLIKFLETLGKKFDEARLVTGDKTGGTGTKTLAERIYGS